MNDESKEEEIMKVDRYGFLISDKTRKGVEIPKAVVAQRKRKENERTQKWIKMIKKWTKYTTLKTDKLKERIRKGVPDALRGHVWTLLASTYDSKLKNPNLYEQYVNQIAQDKPSKDMYDTIERDIERTFPRHQLFRGKSNMEETEKKGKSSDIGAVGQNSLRNILHAYSVLDDEVGYCQGMGFITAMFLTYTTEEDAFLLLKFVMDPGLQSIRGLYLPRMTKTKMVLDIFDRLLSRFLNKLYIHMDSIGISVSMFATQWFVTIFTSSFPFDLVTRVWDIFLFEGWKIVYRTALALLKINQKRMLKADMEGFMSIVRDLPTSVDGPLVVETAMEIPVKQLDIDTLETELIESGNYA